MKKLTITIIALATLAGATMAVHAHGRDGKRGDYLIKRLDKQLDLSEAQENEVRMLIKNTQRQKGKSDRHKVDVLNWGELFGANELSAEQVMVALEEGHEARRKERMRVIAEMVSGVHAILTPNQRQQVVESGGLRSLLGRGKHDDDDHHFFKKMGKKFGHWGDDDHDHHRDYDDDDHHDNYYK